MLRFDLPTPEGDTQPFWDAAREGKLLIKRCGRRHFYTRPFCPHCWSEAVAWEQASGRATLCTYSIVHQEIYRRSNSACRTSPRSSTSRKGRG